MECRVSAFSRTGGREQNEDACGYVEKDGVVCCVLADGAGGHQGGEVASRICVQSVLDEVLTGPHVSTGTLNNLLHNAHQAVLHQQAADPALADMRSTLVVLLFDPVHGAAVWGHIGDSRLYLLRRGVIHMRTRDHSLIQSMIDSGMIAQDDAHNHPDSNVLFASVGLPDAFQPTVLEAPFVIQNGDAFLLCSDGVWGAVNDAIIEQCLGGAVSSDDWLHHLEEKVSMYATSGSDNYSAVGVWCGDAGDFLRTVPVSP